MDTVRDKRRQDELVKVAEQAAEWVIALDEGAPAEHAAFAEWIEESPLHVEMFLRATAVNRMGELLNPADRKNLARSVVAETNHSNVFSLEASPSHAVAALAADAPLPSRDLTRRGTRRVAGLAAAAVLLLVTGGAVLWWSQAGWDTYTTKVGEQRVVQLADGSVVYVNTDTRIDVRYSESARELQLRSGEALFKVERDSKRPFRVHVGDATVQAVGTQFNIYRRPSGMTVAVIEGVVQVSKDHDVAAIPQPQRAAQNTATTSARAAERLAAGQAVNVAADGPIARPVAVNVAQVTAWRQRRLVFEWETLEAIAAEFNRYNRAPQIRIEGDGVRERRYTAVFDADNPQTLLKFLARDADLKFAAEGNDFVIRAR